MLNNITNIENGRNEIPELINDDSSVIPVGWMMLTTTTKGQE